MYTRARSMVKQSLRQTMSSSLCSSFKPVCVFELQMWLLTWRISAKTAGLQRWQSSHRVWHSPGPFLLYPHLHCSFSHVEEVVAVACVPACVVRRGDHLKVHPRALCVHIARHMPFVCLKAGIQLHGLFVVFFLKRFNPGAKRKNLNWVVHFSRRHRKLQILDLWILQKRLILVASAGFPISTGN